MNSVCAKPGLARCERIVVVRSGAAAIAAAHGSSNANARSFIVCSLGLTGDRRLFTIRFIRRQRMPEIIEVEPVVGCVAHVMFQARGVMADVRVQRGVALTPR